MSTTVVMPPLATEDFLRDYGGNPGHELVRGHLLRIPVPGANHDEIEVSIVAVLHLFIKQHQLGRLTCGETLIRVRSNPDTFRGADVTYVSYARWPKDHATPVGPWQVPPDLVVEIRSPSDRRGAIDEKIGEYLDFGVTVVVSVDPELEAISVHRNGEIDVRFHNGDTVTIPDVLPGFAVPVKAFFD